VPGTIAQPRRRPLALLGAQCLGHLGLEQFLQNHLHERSQQVASLGQQRLHILEPRLILPSGHGVHPQVTLPSPAYHDPFASPAFAEPSVHDLQSETVLTGKDWWEAIELE
jgi:hypothetical protein